MAKVLCYSEKEFKELMKKNGWLEEKDLPENVAIISIIGGDDCIKGFFEVKGEEISHWFKNSNDQILNLEFDDVTEEVYIQGYRIYPMSMDQAKEAVKFIEKNVGKDFYIHCRAGKSRSQAFVRFILDCFPDNYNEKEINLDNPPITPNIDVLAKLKRVYWFGE